MTQPKVIALEEHFTSPGLRALRGEKDTPVQRKLDDLGELRIREMDEAGIDLQVISENNPAAQNLDAETAVELARDWRTDRLLRRLEAMLIVSDKRATFLLSGTGDLIEPDDGIVAVGSGGPFAMAAARALARHSQLDARQIAAEAMSIAADICIYTNANISVEVLKT